MPPVRLMTDQQPLHDHRAGPYPGHGEAEGLVRVERAGPAGHVVVAEAEHAETGEQDLGGPASRNASISQR